MILNTKQTPLLVGVLAVACIPHFSRLPFWVSSWCFFFWGYQILGSINGWSLPGRPIRLFLTAIGLGGIYASFGYIIGTEASIGLLVVLTTLKPFEINTYRDKMIMLYMIYFIVISNLFLSLSFMMILYLGLCVLLITTVLIQVNQTQGLLRHQLQLAMKIIVQALPLTIVFFLFFPRFEESIWGLTRASYSTSGFSDTLSPGDISYLVQNEEIAFRASFEASIPKAEQLYWRGLVFHFFDGKSWRNDRRMAVRKEPVIARNHFTYSITLEPKGKYWLFALELPTGNPPNTQLLEDNTLISKNRITKRRQFKVTSATIFTDTLFDEQDYATKLPWGLNPQSRKVAQRWKEIAVDELDIVERARSFFEENGFTYTLTPPLLGTHAVDDFLFSSRRGYCEHYASAFAFLMRAAEVPARVVAGYLGGEFNQYGNYITVRQSDAHAWVEVWLDNRGWVRIDPTSFVAPERIRGGLIQALPPEEAAYFKWNFGFLKRFDQFWDAVNVKWYLWFIDYSQFRQQRFLKFLGIKAISWREPLKYLMYIILPLAFGVGLYILRKGKRSIHKNDAVLTTYDIFCNKLDKVGMHRHAAQGPLDFAEMVLKQRRDLSSMINRIIDLYIRLRYRENGGEKELRYFKSLVKQFKP